MNEEHSRATHTRKAELCVCIEIQFGKSGVISVDLFRYKSLS